MVNNNADSTNDNSSQNQNEEDNNGTSKIDESEESLCTDSFKSFQNSSLSNQKNSDEKDENTNGLNVTDQSAKTSLFCSVPLNKIRSVLGYTNNKNEEDDTKLKQISRKLLCLYCDRTFVSSNLRQKHVERCHSEKQSRRLSSRKLQSQFTTTACFHCDKLPDEHSLKQLFEHLISNHPQKYFGCLVCEERFLNQSLLSDHNAKLHGDSSAPKRQKSNLARKSQKENEVKEEIIEEPINNGGEETSSQKMTRSAVKEKIAAPQSKQLRNKKISIKASKIGLKRSKRLQAAQAKVPVQKRKPKTAESTKAEETSKSSEKHKNTSVNPYPEFDHYYRVKKITDHSIDNLKISSLTFDDVFDQAFFNRIKCNIQENLLYHLDGKLFKNEESESRISNFEKNPPSQDVPSTSSENFGCDLTLNAITPVTSILSSNFGEDMEAQIEYGAKPSKKKLQTRQDPVRHKYVTRRKYQASILERKENRDLSKLDMWTQIIIKDRQQKVLNDQKSAKEMLEYTTCAEYKLKVQRNELNRILDRRGPFEDLKEEATKMAALGNLNTESNNIEDECFKEVRTVMDEILNEVDMICSNENSNVMIKSEGSSSRSDKIDIPELPDYLKLRKTSSLPCDEEIDKSDRIVLICSSQETENYELPTNTVRGKHEMVELSGEWARSRIYVCAACGLKLPNMKFLLDHKSLYHQSAWVQHYELVGNQSELYRHLCIPGLGKVGHVEDTVQCKSWRRSEARVCSKCGKACNALAELHRHVLECGGDWTWMLARKKCKYRPFGSRKKRRGLVKRIRERINNQKTDQPEKKKLKKQFEGPRQRPSDADTIERMLANLPPKRSSRKIICLKDGFPRNLKNSNNKTRVMKCGKIVRKKSTYLSEESKNTSNQNKNASVKRKLRSLNRTISSKIIDTTSKLRVKRQLIKNISKRAKRSNPSKIDAPSEGVKKEEQETEAGPLKKSTMSGQKKGENNSYRVKNMLKEKMNIKHFFPVSKRKAGKTPLKKNDATNHSVDDNKESTNEKLKTTKNVVKKFLKKSLGFQKKIDSNKDDNKQIKQKDEVVTKSLQPIEETKSSKLSNKRKLRSSFRKVIDRVKKLKIDNTVDSNREPRNSNSFLGQGAKEKEKLATVLVPLVEELKENPPSIPAFAQNAIDNNSPTEESLIPENIFNLEHNMEDLLQAKSPLETPLNDIMKSEPKNLFDTPTETKMDKLKVDALSDINSTKIIESETDIKKNITNEDALSKQTQINTNIEDKENVRCEDKNPVASSLETPSKEMSLLTIETESKGNKSPLISPLVSPSLMSPKIKGKLRKPNRGLNDCIAMLTKKAFEETHKADNFLDVNVINKTEENPSENNQNGALKKECILKIPIFERESSKNNIQSEVLDLSKPKPNSGMSKDVIDLSKKKSSVCSTDNVNEKAQNNSNTSNLFNFWNPIHSNGVFSNAISEKAILRIPKIIEPPWTTVDDIIEKVVGDISDSATVKTLSNSQKLHSKVPSVFTANSVDKVIEEVVRGDILAEITKKSNELNNDSSRKAKKVSTSDKPIPEVLSPSQQRLENLGRIIEEVATMTQKKLDSQQIKSTDASIVSANIINCVDKILVETEEVSSGVENISPSSSVTQSRKEISFSFCNENAQAAKEALPEKAVKTIVTKLCGKKNDIRQRTTRNSSKTTANASLNNGTPMERISQTLVASTENEPEILEAKDLISESIQHENTAQSEANVPSIKSKNIENNLPKSVLESDTILHCKQSSGLNIQTTSVKTLTHEDTLLGCHETIEEEPVILEERGVEDDLRHSASTDSEDELPLLVLKNKIEKVSYIGENSPQLSDVPIVSDKEILMMTENQHVDARVDDAAENCEENVQNDENILNTLNDLITGELPFSTEPSRKSETNEKLVENTVQHENFLEEISQSETPQKQKKIGRRKSFRKSSSLSNISEDEIVKSKKSIKSRKNLIPEYGSHQIEEKAPVSDMADALNKEESVIDEKHVLEATAVPLLRVTKIKSRKRVNMRESVKAKLILKLPKIILKEPKLKIHSILGKSMENTIENRSAEPSVTIDLNMDYKPVSSVTHFKSLNETIQKSEEISFKVKSKNKKKGSKHRKKLLIDSIQEKDVISEEKISPIAQENPDNSVVQTSESTTKNPMISEDLTFAPEKIVVEESNSEKELKPNSSFTSQDTINDDFQTEVNSFRKIDDASLLFSPKTNALNNTSKKKSKIKSKKLKSKEKENILNHSSNDILLESSLDENKTTLENNLDIEKELEIPSAAQDENMESTSKTVSFDSNQENKPKNYVLENISHFNEDISRNNEVEYVKADINMDSIENLQKEGISKPLRTLRSSTAKISYKESNITGPRKEEEPSSSTASSIMAIEPDFRQTENGNVMKISENIESSVHELGVKGTDVEPKHVSRQENKLSRNKSKKHRKQSETKIQEELSAFSQNSIPVMENLALNELSSCKNYIPEVEITKNLSSKSSDPFMNLNVDNAQCRSGGDEMKEVNYPENLEMLATENPPKSSDLKGECPLSNENKNIGHKKQNKTKKAKKEKNAKIISITKEKNSLESDCIEQAEKISTNDFRDRREDVFCEGTGETKIDGGDIENNFENKEFLDDSIDKNEGNLVNQSELENDKPSINTDDTNRNFPTEFVLGTKNRKSNKTKKLKKEKNARDELPLNSGVNKHDLHDESFKTDEADIPMKQQRKRNKIKKTKREKFFEDAAYPFVDPVVNDFLNKSDDTKTFITENIEHRTEELQTIGKISKSIKTKEKITEIDCNSKSTCDISNQNEVDSIENVNEVRNTKDAFEFEDDLLPIEELSPKFRKKSYKPPSLPTDNMTNQNSIITDENFLINIEVDTNPKAHEKKKRHKAKENSEHSDKLESVKDINLTRKQRTAKFKALENMNTLQMTLDEPVEKLYGDFQKKRDELSLKKKESKQKHIIPASIPAEQIVEIGGELKDTGMSLENSISPRKNRAAKAKALENIRILELRPDDVLEEERIKSIPDNARKLNNYSKKTDSGVVDEVSIIIDAIDEHEIPTDTLENLDTKHKNKNFRNRVFSNDAMDLEPSSPVEKNVIFNGIHLETIEKHSELVAENTDITRKLHDKIQIDQDISEDMDLEENNELEQFGSKTILPYSERTNSTMPEEIIENCPNELQSKYDTDVESVINEVADGSYIIRKHYSEDDMDLDSNSEHSEKNLKSEDCYDISKIDDEKLNLQEPFQLGITKKKDIVRLDIEQKVNSIEESNSKVFEEVVSVRKNRAAKTKALEQIHDVSLSQEIDGETGVVDALDSSLEKTAVEIMSILGETAEQNHDKIKSEIKRIPLVAQTKDLKKNENSSHSKHKEKKNKKEITVNIAEDTLTPSEHDAGDIFENEGVDDNENKRRSRRACKVNTYNENDLAEAIFLQASAEKEKEKLKKKKAEMSEPTKEKKMNAEELFDLLKATATENFNIPKPVEEPFPDELGDIEDNFDDVFDDILKKSEAIFREKTMNEDDTSNISKSALQDARKGKNLVRKNSESEENPEALYCDICKKSFKRMDNLVKHKTTLTHISKLSEIEARQAEDKLRDVTEEYNDSLKSNSEDIGKSNDSDSLYSYPPTPGNDALKIAEIITNAFDKPPLNPDGFSGIIPPVSQYRRYKSLGERKSFESDQGNSNISDNLDSNSYEPHIANNAGVILQKQLTLLQNIIENRNLNYIDDVSMSSYPSLEQNNGMESSKLEDSSNLVFVPNSITVLEKQNGTEPFLKPPQVEDISEDSLHLKNNDDIKSRKVLNRDEELFLECCSLLKSGSEVSNFSKKSNKTSVINNIALKMSDEPDMFESKNLIEKVREESSDYTRMATPLGDSFGDTSNSNTISSNWGLNTEDQIQIQDKNYFNFKNQENFNDDDSSYSSKYKDAVSKTIKNPFKNVTSFIKNRKDNSPETCFDDEEKDAASDCSSKMITKGALKIFEGLKVSIPTEELNLEEVLINSPPAKKLDVDKLSEHFLSPKTPRNARKSKPIKNKQQIDERFIFKVKKKSPRKDETASEIEQETSDKINDVYDFEETQDNTDVFAKPDFKTFRKGTEDVKNESAFETNYEAQNLSSSSSSVNSVIKKPKTNECITKKKHMIMGRIFKNAMKPKMDEEIRDLPIIDHNELVESYVLSCSPKIEDDFKKPKMTEEEMNYLFDKLLDKPIEESKKQSNQNKPDSKNSTLKKKLKCKKRQRSNSDSTDDEFGLNKIVKKRPSRKNAKVEDNSINLEQELKECIGVASRKSQRKCTSGKQNVLVEYWSSDESAFEAFLENHLQELSAKSETPPAKIEDKEEKPKKLDVPRKSIEKIDKDTKIKKKKVLVKKKPPKEVSTGDYNETSAQSNRRKRTAANPLYHWSSSSEDETHDLIEVKSIRDDPEDEYDEDRPIQHGWIVGDSPKKLVTMLAQAKGKKSEPESSVKEQGKKKNSIS